MQCLPNAVCGIGLATGSIAEYAGTPRTSTNRQIDEQSRLINGARGEGLHLACFFQGWLTITGEETAVCDSVVLPSQVPILWRGRGRGLLL